MLGRRTPRLFFWCFRRAVISTNKWNWILKKFCEVHGTTFTVTQYTARKTLISNVARTITHGLSAAQVVNGSPRSRDHGRVRPFESLRSRRNLRGVSRRISRWDTNTFRNDSAAGGPGLGGKGGRALKREWHRLQLVRAQIVPEAIATMSRNCFNKTSCQSQFARGILCLKQASAKGDCGNVVPDIGRCKHICPAQVQKQNRRDLLHWRSKWRARAAWRKIRSYKRRSG